MSTLREVLRLLFAKNMSYRVIGELAGISHNTARRYDLIAAENNLTLDLVEEMDDNKLDTIFYPKRGKPSETKQLPNFESWLDELKIKGVTLELLWQEYRQHNPDGYSYAHCTRLFGEWSSKLNTTLRMTHLAGEKLFVDYSGTRLKICHPLTGEVDMAEIFVAVMGASNYTYVEASRSQQIPDWIESNVNALTYFGGVPEIIVPDNLKSAVNYHTNFAVKLNPQFVEFAKHYRTVIVPARPKKPKDKAKAEGGVRNARTWILARLRHKVFHSIDEANVEIRKLLIEFNQKPFKKIKGSRLSRFEAIDKPALKPLPSEKYEYADWKIKCRVGNDYTVEYDKVFYMVPHQLVGQYVNIRATTKGIEVFHSNKRVMSCVRSYMEGEFVKEKSFMPENHKNLNEWSRTKLSAWSQSVGDSTTLAFHKLLHENRNPDNGFRTCVAIVEESKIVGLERIESALTIALQINSLNITSLRSIIRTGKDIDNDCNVISENEIQQTFEHIRGGQYYH
ncbi:MAG: IS21 family transposase [Chlorobiaceae bacterium]|nr:IS21 family transposase [Chlorobiaceae bacterium]